MGKPKYNQPKRYVLEPGQSIMLTFNNSFFWPPMVIHYEDGGMQDRIDKKLAAARTPSMLQELLDARRKT
jgi:hypothetical protein